MGRFKVAFETLGCRVNIYDTEAMAEMFIKDGYDVVPFGEAADVYVINTCTVTNMGDRKSRQMIKRAKKLNENAVVCVVGCYAQVASDEIKKMEDVSVILGSRNKSLIVDAANKALATGEKTFEISEVLKNSEFEDLDIEDISEHTRAFLKIQDGCGRFCSYCMIPYARGKSVSRDRVKVLQEIRRLKENGIKEIILSGIHIASYGTDLIKADSEEKKMKGQNILIGREDVKGEAYRSDIRDKGIFYGLIELLEDIETIDGIERVRIGSIEPMFFENEGIKRIAALKKLCPHFHLSLQSGSDSVLQRMNRRYTAREYKETVNMLRDEIPEISLTTDIITGFPGETDEEFKETYEFLKEIKLTKTHVFRYSPRKGTPAAIMKNQVEAYVKEERSKLLIELSNKNEMEFMNSMTGKTFKVLFEEREGSGIRGYTENYLPFVLKEGASSVSEGEIREVKVTHVSQGILRGELL